MSSMYGADGLPSMLDQSWFSIRMRNTVWMGQAPAQVPGRVVVVVVVVFVVVGEEGLVLLEEVVVEEGTYLVVVVPWFATHTQPVQTSPGPQPMLPSHCSPRAMSNMPSPHIERRAAKCFVDRNLRAIRVPAMIEHVGSIVALKRTFP